VVKVGDTVLLPEYGGQKVKLNDQELYIYRDSEIVARV
jgi:chaperonin GroES